MWCCVLVFQFCSKCLCACQALCSSRDRDQFPSTTTGPPDPATQCTSSTRGDPNSPDRSPRFSADDSTQQDHYVTLLGLIPTQRAHELLTTPQRRAECGIIDLDCPLTQRSHCSLRTPKLLISQLIRDAGSSGHDVPVAHLRCSDVADVSTAQLRHGLPADGRVSGRQLVDEHGQRSSALCSVEEETDEEEETRERRKSLLTIDIASCLGQRVLRHMALECHASPIHDAESFCTPVKDSYQSRLRFRETCYPVTYKLTSKRLLQQADSHEYKFLRVEHKRFASDVWADVTPTLERSLLGIRECRVLLSKLSQDTLHRWMPVSGSSSASSIVDGMTWHGESELLAPPGHFPSGPILLSPDIDRILGLKRMSRAVANKLMPFHCLSELTNAELQRQTVTVYRCLLSDISAFSCLDVPASSCEPFLEPPSTCEKSYPPLSGILGTSLPNTIVCQSVALSVGANRTLLTDSPFPPTSSVSSQGSVSGSGTRVRDAVEPVFSHDVSSQGSVSGCGVRDAVVSEFSHDVGSQGSVSGSGALVRDAVEPEFSHNVSSQGSVSGSGVRVRDSVEPEFLHNVSSQGSVSGSGARVCDAVEPEFSHNVSDNPFVDECQCSVPPSRRKCSVDLLAASHVAVRHPIVASLVDVGNFSQSPAMEEVFSGDHFNLTETLNSPDVLCGTDDTFVIRSSSAWSVSSCSQMSESSSAHRDDLVLPGDSLVLHPGVCKGDDGMSAGNTQRFDIVPVNDVAATDKPNAHDSGLCCDMMTDDLEESASVSTLPHMSLPGNHHRAKPAGQSFMLVSSHASVGGSGGHSLRSSSQKSHSVFRVGEGCVCCDEDTVVNCSNGFGRSSDDTCSESYSTAVTGFCGEQSWMSTVGDGVRDICQKCNSQKDPISCSHDIAASDPSPNDDGTFPPHSVNGDMLLVSSICCGVEHCLQDGRVSADLWSCTPVGRGKSGVLNIRPLCRTGHCCVMHGDRIRDCRHSHLHQQTTGIHDDMDSGQQAVKTASSSVYRPMAPATPADDYCSGLQSVTRVCEHGPLNVGEDSGGTPLSPNCLHVTTSELRRSAIAGYDAPLVYRKRKMLAECSGGGLVMSKNRCLLQSISDCDCGLDFLPATTGVSASCAIARPVSAEMLGVFGGDGGRKFVFSRNPSPHHSARSTLATSSITRACMTSRQMLCVLESVKDSSS